nr:unnamed protein product [Trichobilharzia regenti]
MSCAHVLNAARKRQLARLSQWVSCWERGEMPSSENFLLFPCELVDFARLILSLTDQNFGPVVLQAVRKTLDCAKKQIALNKNPPLISLASDDKAIQDALSKLTNEMNTNPTASPPEDQKFSEDKNSSVLSDYTSFIPMKRRSSSPCDAHTDSKSKLRLSESPVMTNCDECPSETENQRQSTNCSVYSMEVDGDSCNRIDLNENRSLKVILTKLETSSTTYRLSNGEDNPNVQLDDDPSISNEQNDQSLSFMHYMWSGCADQKNNPLPHYVSNSSEQNELREQMEGLLNRLHNPCMITIARSAYDGYTPSHQVSNIQLGLLQMLDRVYGRNLLSVTLDYENSENDADELKAMGFHITTPEEFHMGGRRISPISCLARSEGKSVVYRTEPGSKEIV